MHYHSLLPIIGLTLLTGCSAAVIKRDAPGISSNLPSGFFYFGCYKDSPSSRQLVGQSFRDASMTQESCISYCSSKGYSLAGAEYGTECYCGYQSSGALVQVDDSECSMACGGDSTEACGAADRITIFANGQSAPTTNPGTDGWTLLGCYSDTAASRSLSTQINVPGLTVSNCVSACQAKGYSYAGVEYGSECFCDTAIRGNAQVISPGGCNMVCSGDSKEYCGGAGSIDIYHLPNAPAQTPGTIPSGWSALGCYTDTTSARTLAQFASVAGQMTIEGCIASCKSSGYTLAGLEFGRECYCGNEIDNGASLYSDQSACHSPCEGNTAETCGGADAINLYSYASSS